jgi:LmbE family N-acetylglucosaminyl deacetylase
MRNFFQYKKYFFIFAHPDDEIYTCAFIHKLVSEGKDVDLLYITSGDYQGPEVAGIRETELTQSMQVLNVRANNLHLLRIPERKLVDNIKEVLEKTLVLAHRLSPDCVVGHDFESGHNGHDAVSFIASCIAEKFGVSLYAFPAYSGWPEERQWNQFASSREVTDTLPLTADLKVIQDRVIAAHKSQQVFFDTVMQSNSYVLFSSREVLSYVSRPIDYAKPPTIPVGYEYPNSKIHFSDFRKTILSIHENPNITP